MRTETVTIYDCSCGRTAVVHETDEELPIGFHGTTQQITASGGSASVAWWACKAAHIRASVEAALNEAARA